MTNSPRKLPNHRIDSIDIVRGMVMIIMALDHTREFFHYGALKGDDPLNLTTTTPALFLTRWITHFCAPIFVFLSGTSIYLYSKRVKHQNQLAKFLFTRGWWLVFAEILIVNGLWFFSYFQFTMLQVFYAIGMSMVCMALLQYLPRYVIVSLGLLIVVGHHLLDGIAPGSGIGGVLYNLAFSPNLYQPWPGYFILVAYPFVPWLGIMMLGYGIGRLYDQDVTIIYRQRLLTIIAAAAIGIFVLLRFTGIYGDRVVWSPQPSLSFSILQFLNTNKYPPSLQYSLMTLGPALLALALAEKFHGRFARILGVYGRVPFVYYMLHVLLIHLLAVLNATITHHGTGLPVVPGLAADPDAGYPLWVVYLIWALVVVILFFPCRWYSRYRAAHPEKKWLRYL